MLFLVGCFSLFYFLGAPLLPLSPMVQLFAVPVLASFPIAVLGMLPNAVLADIAVHDAQQTGTSNQGMFFAVRSKPAAPSLRLPHPKD